MSLRIIKTKQQFAELKPGWDNLTREPFRSFEWNYAWWSSFGQAFELHIYCYEVDGEIVGIAPFFVDCWIRQKRLRFLGSGTTCTDYAEVIAKPEFQQEFVESIAKELNQSGTIGMLELEGIRGEGNNQLLCDTMSEAYWRYDRELEPTWLLSLPDSWEQFVSSTKKSLRRKIRKAVKRLDQGEAQFRSTQGDLDLESTFDLLIDLHQQRFESKGEPGVFSDPRFTTFLRTAVGQLHENKMAEILVGYFENQPIVAQLYLIGSSGPQLYQAGVRPDKMNLEPGHLLFTAAVRQAIENGYPTFDFLRGNESYKSYWGAIPQQLLKVRCVSKQLAPTTVNQTYRFLRTCKHGCAGWLTQFSSDQ